MPVTLELRADGHVLVYTFRGRWNVSEVMALFPEEKHYRDKASHIVHALVDVQESRNIPAGLINLRHGPGPGHPRAGYVVFVGAPPMGRPLITAIYRVMRFERFRFFDTAEEAWAFLNRLILTESTTPPLQF
jgi:hypothetical protein